MNGDPYDRVFDKCSVEMCAQTVARRFTTSDGQHLALCTRHDEMFYATCIAAATPRTHVTRGHGRQHRESLVEFEFRREAWQVPV